MPLGGALCACLPRRPSAAAERLQSHNPKDAGTISWSANMSFISASRIGLDDEAGPASVTRRTRARAHMTDLV